MLKEMNSKNKQLDSKKIEEWINLILTESEQMQELPDTILKPEARFALTRYGLDRMTLTNAGIPNEEVTRLYNSLYVYTHGYYNLIKEVSSKVNESYLGLTTPAKTDKHMTRTSIVSGIWRVFSMLLENTH